MLVAPEALAGLPASAAVTACGAGVAAGDGLCAKIGATQRTEIVMRLENLGILVLSETSHWGLGPRAWGLPDSCFRLLLQSPARSAAS